jgi:hypothetical protein
LWQGKQPPDHGEHVEMRIVFWEAGAHKKPGSALRDGINIQKKIAIDETMDGNFSAATP